MRFSKYLILFAALMVAVIPVLGQEIDLPETFTFDTGSTFHYPAGSDIVQDETAPEFVSLELGDNQFLNLLDFAFFEAEGLDTDEALEDVLAWYVDYLFGGAVEYDADAVEALDEAAGREALRLSYVDDAGNAALLIAVRFEDGTFGLIDAFADSADFEADDLALAVATSFDSSTAPVVAVDTTPCTLSTAQANTVQLRVGPGINRTVYAFLPTDREFTPLGKATTSDDSEWFQLDKDEVAPNAAAAEAWIAADSVDTSGNCDTIGEASAPPVIPIIPAGPPAGNNNSGSSGGDSGAGDTSTIAPVPGTWTISYASTGKGSCLENPGFTFDFPVGWTPDVVQLSFTGSTLVMSGNRFARLGSGAYSGVFTTPGGNSFELILRPVSSSQFVGEARLTGIVDGHTCSNTVPTTVTRN